MFIIGNIPRRGNPNCGDTVKITIRKVFIPNFRLYELKIKETRNEKIIIIPI